jgi:LacI family transcriptional regulator
VTAPRVLIMLDTSAAWSRGIMLGFAGVAHARGWTLMHYPPQVDLHWLLDHLRPNAVVCGPSLRGPWPAALRERVSVVVNADRSDDGVASVCLDEERVSDIALQHLLSRGLRNLAVFRFDDAAFALARARRFQAGAQRVDVRLAAGWETSDGHAGGPLSIAEWLRRLPQPCGVFACCDNWARVLTHYARLAGVCVPERMALVGVDNDLVECQLAAPPLSSVAISWRSMGEAAAELVALGLRGTEIAGKRVLIEPIDLIARRSTSTLAIEDRLVARAVTWIREHAHRRLLVPMVAEAVGVPRQRLERCFRAALGRSIMEEVRRAHVELASQLLLTTELPLVDIARRSGFTTAALLSVAFAREIGMPPGAYRRRAGSIAATEDD